MDESDNRIFKSERLGAGCAFFEAVFMGIVSPTVIVNYTGHILCFNNSAADTLGLTEGSIDINILKQDFIPSRTVKVFAQILAKERLDIYSGKHIVNIVPKNQHSRKFRVKVSKIAYRGVNSLVLTFSVFKATAVQFPTQNRFRKDSNDVKLRNISKALTLCNQSALNSSNVFHTSLCEAEIDESSRNLISTSLRFNTKGMELSVNKINIINQLYNNTLKTDFKYHSISEVVDEVVEDLAPLVDTLAYKINKAIDKNSFGFFDKDSLASLLANLLFIKLGDSSEKDIEISTNTLEDAQEITLTCCKGDFPYSKQAECTDEYISELMETDKGLNKSLWSLIGSEMIDINRGKILYSDVEDDETVHIHLPVSPVN